MRRPAPLLAGSITYGPFIAAGIPAGGLFTGAEGIKTAEEAAVFGGIASQHYDQCYHLGCDRASNLSSTALDQMSDAMAHATITLATSTEALGGERAAGRSHASAFRMPHPRKLTD